MSNLIRGLTQIERLVLILRCWEKLQWKEIAQVLGLSELLVEQTYVRVLKDQMTCLL